MPANFLELPRELRDCVYELCLLHEESINPWAGSFQRQELTPGLLRVNKTVHQEARFLLYSQNRFDCTEASPEDIASFLETIGHNNADCIRQVYINFPDFLYLDPGDIALKDDSIAILTSIQISCTKLRTLTISPYSTYAMELRLDALDYPKIATEALKLVDTRFRAITSLQEIVVEVYENGPSGYIRRKMESYNWTVRITEDEGTEDEGDWDTGRHFFSDSEDDWGDDYSYDSREDDYDIDNDSDFWRRAADD